jgi:hypothetical protein
MTSTDRATELVLLNRLRRGDAGAFDEVHEVYHPRLFNFLASLPRTYREVLLLVWVEGLTPAEAALVCGIRPEALRQRLSRARSLLADRLARTDDACLVVLGEVLP